MINPPEQTMMLSRIRHSEIVVNIQSFLTFFE
ncbi:hypothetical protein J467_4306, partial [Acinetobacter baumannii 916567]